MEHAKIMLITVHEAIATRIRLVIIGGPINTPIGTLLRIVTIAANHTEIDQITIDLVGALLKVTMDLVTSIRACVHLTINIITSMNIEAIRNSPFKMTIVQEIVGIPSLLTHVHHIKGEANTEDPNSVNLIAAHLLLEILIAIKDKLAVTTVTRDSLVVMIATGSPLVIHQDPIHKIHAGRVVRKNGRTIIQISRMKIHDIKQSGSYMKVTTSILIA